MWLNSRWAVVASLGRLASQLGSSASVGCGVVGVLWWLGWVSWWWVWVLPGGSGGCGLG